MRRPILVGAIASLSACSLPAASLPEPAGLVDELFVDATGQVGQPINASGTVVLGNGCYGEAKLSAQVEPAAHAVLLTASRRYVSPPGVPCSESIGKAKVTTSFIVTSPGTYQVLAPAATGKTIEVAP